MGFPPCQLGSDNDKREAGIESLSEAKQISFSINLIHRDSQLSPLYNQSLTPIEHLRKAVMRSFSRVNLFYQYLRTSEKEISSVMIPNEGDYLMKLYIGTPPSKFIAIADTGSNLMWIRCHPYAKKFRPHTSIFDPKTSSSYREIDYDTIFCKDLDIKERGGSNECKYSYRYGEGSYTNGILSSETFTVNTTSGGSISFLESIFGCSKIYHGFDSNLQGIVGLGPGPLSLVSQLGIEIEHKFSYCLLRWNETTSSSKLRFGSEAKISTDGVVSTKLVPMNHPHFYHLTLEGVSIRNNRTKTHESLGNIIIDSGTTFTMLPSNMYNDLEVIVKMVIGMSPVSDPSEQFNLCFEEESMENISLPDMVFHFTGADLRLQPINTFTSDYNGLVCMMIFPNNDLPIFGNVAQVNFQVEYDLKEKQVSFAPTDCTKF
ncbi:probable aspartic protease At2g35615 [Tripterygium wilfordii]|uniref:probable aspartic protease At2g35615 n=1 Tax=Tripterygium wilfordii TaxID=458696 RepID=UPI0018F82A0E|nr:probable aspartic protease At2g35615 [Tripterygium wilfordii]